MRRRSFVTFPVALVAGLCVPQKISASEKKPGIFLVHGVGETRAAFEALSRYFESNGYLTYSASFHSSGSLRECYIDVRQEYDKFLANPDLDTSRVLCWGYSLGAYLVTWLTTEREITDLVLQAPATYPDFEQDRPLEELFAGSFAKSLMVWRNSIHTSDEALSFYALESFRGKALVLWGDRDERIPRVAVDSIVAALGKKELKIFPGDAHVPADVNTWLRYAKVVREWMGAIHQ